MLHKSECTLKGSFEKQASDASVSSAYIVVNEISFSIFGQRNVSYDQKI
jgi:hypothetical protein